MKAADVERIDAASLRILDEVGVRLEHDGIVARLLAAGARPGGGPQDVRLPAAMVRELVALAPRRVELAGRKGVSLVWGLGQLESEMTLSLAESLALDVVREVGIAGSYLETGHTFEHHRRELFPPRLLNRRPRSACPGPLHEVAAARARELLAGEAETTMTGPERAALLSVERAFASE